MYAIRRLNRPPSTFSSSVITCLVVKSPGWPGTSVGGCAQANAGHPHRHPHAPLATTLGAQAQLHLATTLALRCGPNGPACCRSARLAGACRLRECWAVRLCRGCTWTVLTSTMSGWVFLRFCGSSMYSCSLDAGRDRGSEVSTYVGGRVCAVGPSCCDIRVAHNCAIGHAQSAVLQRSC